MSTAIVKISRRDFLKAGLGAGAGLALGFTVPQVFAEKATAVSKDDFELNAFVRIGIDNTVTVISKHLEMGQGTYTGMATLVAEELDAAWEQVKVIGAPADASRYNNLFWGKAQGTGGSNAVANAFNQMRKAGATAREMLVQAAAKQWQVEAGEINVADGKLSHAASQKQASFGEMAEAAAQQSVPAEVFTKDPEDFKLIGKVNSRKDTSAKIDGTAKYTQDIKLPAMLTAVVSHPPLFGATLKNFDATKAQAVKGVAGVVQIPSGVAVLAKDFWSAKLGRDALNLEWDESHAFKQGTDELVATYRELAKTPGATALDKGDAAAHMKNAKQTLSATYEVPYLAHASMEPLNCVVHITDAGCEIWNGEQMTTGDQYAVAKLLGIKPEQVTINMLFAGGSFGRRANPHADYVLEAVNIAKAHGGKVPVKMVWTREDDMRGGYYRPMFLHSIKAGIDKAGNINAWQHRIVGQSIMQGTAFEGQIKNGIDRMSVEGVSNLPYAVPNISVDLHSPKAGVPVQWWRSVGSTHSAFAVECFIDEIAAATNKDPLLLRRELLKEHPRHLGVMNLAAEKAGWGKTLAKGRGRGIAVHESFGSYVAQVAEVSVKDDGKFSVDRVVIAVDCGIAINPDIIRAQMEGGMGYGLAATLSSKISLNKGHVVQSNFHDYIVLRMNQMPTVEVYIVPSTEQPSGVGEPATPVIAPAVANALYAATGQRFYELPLTLKA